MKSLIKVKKIIGLFFILTLNYSFSQNQTFKFNQNGLTQNIIVELNNFKANEIYNKSINWIKDKYHKPNDVIDATIENESVKFSSVENVFRIYNAFGEYKDYPLEYTIKVSFKDNKYKFEVLYMNVIHESIDFSEIQNVIYKKNGTLIKWYRDTPEMLENFFNELNKSLKNHILGNNLDNDW